MQNRYSFLSIVFFMSLFITSQAATASPASEFDLGAKSFKSGDYKTAITHFENARQQGLNTTALYYNLGSSYFKAGEYEKAASSFKRLTSDPKIRALAEYNLGLIALKMNDRKNANAWFSASLKHTIDPKLKALANRQINKTSASYQKPWSVFLSANVGNDDNINIAPSGSLPTKISESFYKFLAVGDYRISGRRTDGWVTDAVYYTNNYSGSNTYDESSYGAGLKKTFRISDWYNHVELHVDKYTFGTIDYQSINRFEARGNKHLDRNKRLVIRYRYEDINSDNVLYDYLQGQRQKLRGEYRQYDKQASFRTYYELETNNRQDTATASYSPTRHTLRGYYTYYFTPKWRASGDLSYRVSDYPVVATSDRNDKRARVGADLTYAFDKTLKARAKIVYTKNNSTLAVYDYDRTLVSIGLSKLF